MQSPLRLSTSAISLSLSLFGPNRNPVFRLNSVLPALSLSFTHLNTHTHSVSFVAVKLTTQFQFDSLRMQSCFALFSLALNTVCSFVQTKCQLCTKLLEKRKSESEEREIVLALKRRKRKKFFKLSLLHNRDSSLSVLTQHVSLSDYPVWSDRP